MELSRRPRRLRRTPAIRALVRETRLSADQLVYPLFVCEGTGVRRAVSSMPGVFQLSVDEARAGGEGGAGRRRRAPSCCSGCRRRRTPTGSAAWDAQGPVPRAVRGIVAEVPDLVVITDVCLCEYTEHGHCGVLEGERDPQRPDARAARAIGARRTPKPALDVVAPSDMMDGRVGAIRSALDDARLRGRRDPVLRGEVRSAFYGPFREAAESAPQFGDRRGYQMDPANAREALREVALDVDEGADIVMVKPALPYLDVISRGKRDALRRADRRVQRQRRVRDAQGGRRARLDRRDARDARDADRRSAAPAPTSSSPTTPATPRGSLRTPTP